MDFNQFIAIILGIVAGVPIGTWLGTKLFELTHPKE